jgi:hypothetical protein
MTINTLNEQIGTLKTRMGAAYPGSHATFRGHDLHKDLRDMDWAALYLFGVTGRQFTNEQVEMVQAIWVYTSYPDARLWNNRVAAMAANARSCSNLGNVAAMAISDAQVYGGYAGLRAVDFLQDTLKRVNSGEDLESIVLAEAKANRIYGYGRPINSTDERLPWIMELAEKLKMANGPHLKLAFAVEEILVKSNPALKMNYAAIHAAFVSDMGITPREYQILRAPIFMAGVVPCIVEGMEKPPGTIFALRCEDVKYAGVPARKWIK